MGQCFCPICSFQKRQISTGVFMCACVCIRFRVCVTEYECVFMCLFLCVCVESWVSILCWVVGFAGWWGFFMWVCVCSFLLCLKEGYIGCNGWWFQRLSFSSVLLIVVREREMRRDNILRMVLNLRFCVCVFEGVFFVRIIFCMCVLTNRTSFFRKN